MKHTFKLGRGRLHVWTPMHPTRFGTDARNGLRTVSLRWVMFRVYKAGTFGGPSTETTQ